MLQLAGPEAANEDVPNKTAKQPSLRNPWLALGGNVDMEVLPDGTTSLFSATDGRHITDRPPTGPQSEPLTPTDSLPAEQDEDPRAV